GNYRHTTHRVVLQHLSFKNAQASGTAIPPAQPPASQGTEIDGGGGVILINDGELLVVDCTFTGNACAQLGPDVAGGAISATGSLDVTVVGSTFANNSGANGGAIGALNSTLTLVNNLFDGNQATGHGENYIDPHNAQQEDGSGGNGGAVNMD